MEMKPRKERILQALDAHVRQRSGMDYRNYGDPVTYRAEQRQITRDLHDYRILRSAVAWRDIDADALLEASRRAYSGRLTLTEKLKRYTADTCPGRPCSDECDHVSTAEGVVAIDYCTGQYFPTEYRRAACAVLATALWDYARENAPVDAGPIEPHSNLQNLGTWLRDRFRREFGPRLAHRYFD